MTIIKIVKEVS